MIELGRFYFKQTANGNLSGEYSHEGIDANYTETANLTSVFQQSFIGKYDSVWLENGPESLELEIGFKPKTNDKIYTLKWLEKNGNSKFEGEGFLVDDILIGSYR